MPKKLKKIIKLCSMVFVIGILTLLLPEKGAADYPISHSVLLQTQPQSCTTEDFIFIVPMTRMPHPASPLTTSRI